MIVPATEAMRLCALKMESLSPDDAARPDVRTIYAAAAQIHATSLIGRSTYQADDRIDVPDWLAG